MVMVKALSYGSGSYEIANILQHEKVDYLGVAFTDEGIELRENGISLPIMVMSPAAEDFKRIIDAELEPELFSFRSLDKFIEEAKAMQISNYPVHIKIDTGMHRLGFMENEIDKLIDILKNSNIVYVKWIFSHLAASDDARHDNFSREQIRIFNSIHQKISLALGYTPGRHILNSAGIERFPDAHFEMVRLGIGLHGISSKKNDLLPVSTLKTHISQIKLIPEGDTIGYNRSGKANQEMKIGIIPIGYADGLDRKFGNGVGNVIIQDRKIPFIGDICMDMSMVDLTDLNCIEGEEVIIFGEKNQISTLARQINTIPYEILTNISSRVKRVYVKD
jgi:alanine racemase